MKYLICLIMTFVSSFYVFGQEYSIRGLVQDSQGDPLSYASIRIKVSEKAEETIQGVFSDEGGVFEIRNIPKGSYLLDVTMLGVMSVQRKIEVNGDIDVGTIVLADDTKVLEEVTIIARKDPLTRKIDRLVMNVEDNAAYAGRSSLELFSAAPGVLVNNGSISINGMWGTRVMVDGRLLNLVGEDLKTYLQNLRAEDIKSIEIIARPPAEYDAAGSGGLINIIMKKNANNGLNARLGHDYSKGLGRYPSYLPNVGLSYKAGKLTMSLDYSYQWSKGFQEVEQQRSFPGEGNYEATNSGVHKHKNNRFRFSTTYDINEQQFIALDYTGSYGTFTDSLNSITNIIYPQAIGNTRAIGVFPSFARTDFTNVGLNYSWKTDTLGSSFRVVSDYTYNDKNAHSGTINSTFDARGVLKEDTTFNFYYPSTSKIFTADVKYLKKFISGMELAAGVKLSSTEIDNKNAFDILSGGLWRQGVDVFDYLYKERITAGFASISGDVWGAEFNIGLRGEHSDISGEIIGGGQDTLVTWDYFNLFPTVFLQKPVDDDGRHILTLSANRRIKRPSYLELNPYRYYIDNYSVQTGNPFLVPQFTNALELGYLFKQKYYLSFSYNRSKDVINQVIETDTETELMTILRKNTGKEEVYTATISVPITITSWWRTTNNFLLTRSKSVAPEFDLLQNSFVAQTEQEINLPKAWNVNVSAFYTPGVLQGNIITGSIAGVDIGIQKKLLQDRLSGRISVSGLFYTNNFEASSYYNDAVIKIRQRDQTRVFSLALTYNLNIGKTFKLRTLDKSNAEERSRL